MKKLLDDLNSMGSVTLGLYSRSTVRGRREGAISLIIGEWENGESITWYLAIRADEYRKSFLSAKPLIAPKDPTKFRIKVDAFLCKFRDVGELKRYALQTIGFPSSVKFPDQTTEESYLRTALAIYRKSRQMKKADKILTELREKDMSRVG